MKEYIINECIALLKRQDIKSSVKEFIDPILRPIISILVKEICPYIYMVLTFVIISFLLHLGIFIIIVRNNKIFL